MGLYCSKNAKPVCQNVLNHGVQRLMSLNIDVKHQVTTCSGLSCICRVIDVYDGDTITVAVDSGHVPLIYKLRLIDIDAPERKPRLNKPSRDLEKLAANLVTEWLKQFILGRIVMIHFKGEDKYGRRLGYVHSYDDSMTFLSVKSINQELLDKRYAKKYSGATKESFNDYELTQIESGLQCLMR